MIFFTASPHPTFHTAAEVVPRIHQSTQTNSIKPIRERKSVHLNVQASNFATPRKDLRQQTNSNAQPNNDKYAKQSISVDGMKLAEQARTSEVSLKHNDFIEDSFAVAQDTNLYCSQLPKILHQNAYENNARTSQKSYPLQCQSSTMQKQKDAISTTSQKIHDEDVLGNYHEKLKKCSEIFKWTPATDDERYFQENFFKVSRNV